MIFGVYNSVSSKPNMSKSKSKSKLRYDQRSVCQSVLVSSTHLGLTTRLFYYSQTVASLLMWGALSDERTCLPRDSWPYFTLSDSRLPQPRGPGPQFITPRNMMAQLYPQSRVPFSPPPTTRRAMVVVFEAASTLGKPNTRECELCYYRRSVGQSILI
jgi:hypothetical protein